MTNSKELILNTIRHNRPGETKQPATSCEWTGYANRRERFAAVLHSVGGDVLVARDTIELAGQLKQSPVYSEKPKVVSLVPGIDSRNFDWSEANSPHALNDVDVAIVPGEFGVAENAAVWVTARNVPHRVLYFLCQHLVLVIPASQIVDHMHAAYDRLAHGGEFSEAQFGAFISGPSKTADIEQSLVIGAHGSRSLTVCLLEE